MAYNYISLVNDVNRRLNEVELTDSNFSVTTGFYSFAKDSVNSSIRHINQEEFEWPWNHVEESEILVSGTARYSYPYDAKTVNMNTFRIKRNDALSVTTHKLKVLSYEEYLDKYADSEYNSNSDSFSVPTHVVRTPSRELIFYPTPKEAYEVIYEYFRTGYDLESALDVPTLPEQYRYVITDGAMYYVYQFRGDTQAAQLSLQKFEQGIKQLRSLHINRTDYLRDTRVHF
ncbi:hypothetical protein OAD41_00160 [bacterium]|nr:hypothetical protein [bacterium]|tara:strand:- start:167 stop:856 length:690 start_codon:yes stop_codon:yes gene_type:complete